MYLRTWRLRHRPSFNPFDRRDGYVHGNCHGGRCDHASRLRRLTMLALASFVCGLLFGFGLFVSGMTQPAKVLGFLDVFGVWDPTLAFVMAAALLVSFVGFRVARQRAKPVLAAEHLWPNSHGYRPAPPDWVSPVWGRVGLGWALPGTGAREPRNPNAASGRVRACHGSRFGGQGPVGQVSGWPRNESAFDCERRLIPSTRGSRFSPSTE